MYTNHSLKTELKPITKNYLIKSQRKVKVGTNTKQWLSIDDSETVWWEIGIQSTLKSPNWTWVQLVKGF